MKHRKQAILFDLDGVLYEGTQAVSGATDVIAWIRTRRIPHLYLTNTTSRPRQAIVDKLAAMGIPAEADEILTPSLAAVAWLSEHQAGPVALFVPEATREEYRTLSLLEDERESGARAVVVGDLGDGWDFATLNRAFRLLMAEPRPALIALGMTRYWRALDGLRLDTGCFVVALSHASGVTPVVLGKPDAAFFRMALRRLGVEAHHALMIGDDIRGDIGGAQDAGIDGILVRTGKFRPSDLRVEISPYDVLDSVAGLPDWWKNNQHELR